VSLSGETSSAYEAEANRLRARIGATVDELRDNLTPSNLASQAAARVGIADLSWGGAFDYASKRHPLPTAIIGLGLAFWTLAAIRRRNAGGTAGLASPLRETSTSLVDSATKVLRDRAETKRREFVDVAQAKIETGAANFSDEVERRLESVIHRVPGGPEVRPLVQAAVQIALSAAVDSLLHRRDAGWTPRSRQP
jgi:hypothetical protein